MEFFSDQGIDLEADHPFVSEYFDDPYDSPKVDVDYDYEDVLNANLLSPFSFGEILEHCIEPTLTDGLKHIGKLMLWCIIFRVLSQSSSSIPYWVVHSMSAVIGVVVSMHFFYSNVTYLVGLTFLSWLMLHFCHRYVHTARGLLSAILCVSFNMICELFISHPVDWHQIRGAQMILSMKLISLAFDMDSDVNETMKEEMEKKSKQEDEDHEKTELSKKNQRKLRNRFPNAKGSDEKRDSSRVEPELVLAKVPTFFEYFGYALCPGTTVLGPWVPYKDYVNIFINPRWNFTWLIKILFSMVSGFMFLTMSTCWISWFIPKNEHRWIAAYRDAMSFRASHYFVSFMSGASAVAAGFGSSANQARWDMPVAEPQNIELPRSLVEVVVSWNIPMHKWLKKYCFKKTIGFGKWTAVMTTFLASTFLHGFNFQLGSVLMSLGFFIYTENQVRSKLSLIFNASIGTRKGTTEQNFRHKEAAVWVMLVNFGFGILAYVHLMYLGVMFDQSEVQTEGYKWTHTIAKWESLNFFSHYFMGMSFLLSLVL